ncbi:MAG: DUF1732 domain-containing protein [Bacteroidales bacterium]
MIESMTGYGKGERICDGTLFKFEIRAVNSKSLDLAIKGQLLPREKEAKVREVVAAKLKRGSVDLYLSAERSEVESGYRINREVVGGYLKELREIAEEEGIEQSNSTLLELTVRLPKSVESDCEGETLQELALRHWHSLEEALNEALEMVLQFRVAEGEMLNRELSKRVETILQLSNRVEQFEKERELSLRNRLLERSKEFKESLDPGRFEQELLYYTERVDITEERVRLKQHCNYFIKTKEESAPGKKLGFITQEMGREINTLGSKANHFEIQKIVVEMKEELEKIKEQLLNVL